MDLERIRTIALKRPGGIKRLAQEVNMSHVNLFRCLRENSIKAQDLERIARVLNVNIAEFFPNAQVHQSISAESAVSSAKTKKSAGIPHPSIEENEELRARIAQLEEHLRDKEEIITLLREKMNSEK